MNRTPAPDPRTPEQKALDAQIAEGNWESLYIERLLSSEGADQILQHCSNLQKEIEMDQTIAMGTVKGQPFRWKDKVFRILRCDYSGGKALVEVVPHDAEFVAEVSRRIESDRFHTLTYYQGFGFACFPEDYEKYQNQ